MALFLKKAIFKYNFLHERLPTHMGNRALQKSNCFVNRVPGGSLLRFCGNGAELASRHVRRHVDLVHALHRLPGFQFPDETDVRLAHSVSPRDMLLPAVYLYKAAEDCAGRSSRNMACTASIPDAHAHGRYKLYSCRRKRPA